MKYLITLLLVLSLCACTCAGSRDAVRAPTSAELVQDAIAVLVDTCQPVDGLPGKYACDVTLLEHLIDQATRAAAEK